MATAIFCMNNMYYYAKAKRVIQNQKKRVRFRIDERPPEKMPLNCSDFQEAESYVEPISAGFALNHYYPIEFIPKESNKQN